MTRPKAKGTSPSYASMAADLRRVPADTPTEAAAAAASPRAPRSSRVTSAASGRKRRAKFVF